MNSVEEGILSERECREGITYRNQKGSSYAEKEIEISPLAYGIIK